MADQARAHQWRVAVGVCGATVAYDGRVWVGPLCEQPFDDRVLALHRGVDQEWHIRAPLGHLRCEAVVDASSPIDPSLEHRQLASFETRHELLECGKAVWLEECDAGGILLHLCEVERCVCLLVMAEVGRADLAPEECSRSHHAHCMLHASKASKRGIPARRQSAIHLRTCVQEEHYDLKEALEGRGAEQLPCSSSPVIADRVATGGGGGSRLALASSSTRTTSVKPCVTQCNAHVSRRTAFVLREEVVMHLHSKKLHHLAVVRKARPAEELWARI